MPKTFSSFNTLFSELVYLLIYEKFLTLWTLLAWYLAKFQVSNILVVVELMTQVSTPGST